MAKELTAIEERAINWAKSNYPHWRKRFGKTLEQHMENKPADWPIESWKRIYYQPFGIPRWNCYVRIVRKLLLAGEI